MPPLPPLWQDAVALARVADDRYFLADTLLGAASALAERYGDLARARAYADEGERLACTLDPTLPNAMRLLGLAATTQGIIAHQAGDRAVATAHHAESVRLQRAAGGGWMLCLSLLDWGLNQESMGDFYGATPALIEALALTWRRHADAGSTREGDEEIFFIQEFRGLAAAAAATGQPHAAARLLGAAEGLVAQVPYASFADWMTHESIAGCRARLLGNNIDTRTLQALSTTGTALTLDQAVALARQVAVTILGAARVEALWEEAGDLDPRPVPRLSDQDLERTLDATPAVIDSTLTFREQGVLALLCHRLTDAEIAERLFISPRTASRHVGNILGKLGAANRREAAAIAARRRLV